MSTPSLQPCYTCPVTLTPYDRDQSYFIGLPRKLMEKLHLPFGKLTLVNPETHEALRIKSIVDSATLDLSMTPKGVEECTQIVVSKEIIDYLKLSPGSQALLQSHLTPTRGLKEELHANPSNLFGKKNSPRGYLADAVFKKCCDDKVKRCPAIFLTAAQIDFLSLNASLRPLCGSERFGRIYSPTFDVKGVIKIFYNDTVVEADVYMLEKPGSKFHDSTVVLSKSLYEAIGRPQLGDELKLCSRFDVDSWEEARQKEDCPPVLEREPMDAIEHIKDTITWSQKNWLNKSSEIAEFLEGLSDQAQVLVDTRYYLMHAFKILDRLHVDVIDLYEYKQFIEALKKCTFSKETQNDCVSDSKNNPSLVKALIKAEIPFKDTQKQNFLHKSLTNPSINFSGLGTVVSTLITEKRNDGLTPLHIACSIINHYSKKTIFDHLDQIKDALKCCNPNDFVDRTSGTPFHCLFNEGLKENTYAPKVLLLKMLVNVWGEKAVDWLDEKDATENKPFDFIFQSDLLNNVLGLLKNDPSNESVLIVNKLNQLYGKNELYQSFMFHHVIDIPPSYSFPVELQPVFSLHLSNEERLEKLQEAVKLEGVKTAFKNWASENVELMKDPWMQMIDLTFSEMESSFFSRLFKSDFSEYKEANMRHSIRFWESSTASKRYYKEGILSHHNAMLYLKKCLKSSTNLCGTAPLLSVLPQESLIEILSTENEDGKLPFEIYNNIEGIQSLFKALDSETLLKVCLIKNKAGKAVPEMEGFFCMLPHLSRLERPHLRVFLSQEKSSGGGSYLHDARILKAVAPNLPQLNAEELYPILPSRRNDESLLKNDFSVSLLLPTLLKLPLRMLASLIGTRENTFFGLEELFPLLQHLSQRLDLLLTVLIKMSGSQANIQILTHPMFPPILRKFKGDNLYRLLSAQNESGKSLMHNREVVASLLPQILDLSRPRRKELLNLQDNGGNTPLHDTWGNKHYAQIYRDFEREELEELFSRRNLSGQTPFDVLDGKRIIQLGSRLPLQSMITLIHAHNSQKEDSTYENWWIRELIHWFTTLKQEEFTQLCLTRNGCEKTLLDYPEVVDQLKGVSVLCPWIEELFKEDISRKDTF